MNELKKVNWLRVLLFYGILLLSTFLARKLPNILQVILGKFTEINIPWNYNHGIAILLISFIFYKFSDIKSGFSLLGTNKLKSILFPIVLLTGYTIYGIENKEGINPHPWAFIFCLFTLIYDIMEEYTWRGYLIESLEKTNLIIKSLISGVFWRVWHLLIFRDFEQYGGFGIFLVFCILFSFLLTFSISRTKSIIVPATIHALLIRTNIVTLICFLIYVILLFTWNKKLKNTHRSK
ncbi:CPBP family intramembrane metalloprotease [Riemerella anatipestifer]|uniref:CPBP family intramembrane glutamic endopeptidase n=1 Tax=Riemerella anatipestifer TaxID=34085 RepID=UPI00129EFA52|nr:CPBP family intramembrane glutamic endopeptidase [Riemerella anatipestifer]MRM94716.1 CPBP family intramembrane metalloprotease [Riemerella anatipestifer]